MLYRLPFIFKNWFKKAQSPAVDLAVVDGVTYVIYNSASKIHKDKIKNAGFKWKSFTFNYKGLPQTGAWGSDMSPDQAAAELQKAGVPSNPPQQTEIMQKVEIGGRNLYLDIPRSKIVAYGKDVGKVKKELNELGFKWDGSAAVPTDNGVIMGGWSRIGRISVSELDRFKELGFNPSEEMIAKKSDATEDSNYSDVIRAKLENLSELDKDSMQSLVETLIDSVAGEFSEENMTEVKEKAKKFLEFSSKFWNLSWMNQMLLHIQKPYSSFVKREKAWNEMGRKLKADAKPAILFEPVGPRIKLTEQQRAKLRSEGFSEADIKKQDGRIIAKSFRPFGTYDISDTEVIPGREADDASSIADVWRKKNEGGEYESALINAIVRVAKEDYKFAVDFEDTGSAGGFSTGDRRIVIHKDSAGLRAVGTTLHELVHEVFHDKERRRSARADSRGKQILEIEAESGAYLVMRAFGLEGFEDASKAYITLWKGNQEDVRSAMNRMKDIVSEIITRIKDKMGIAENAPKDSAESPAQKDVENTVA